MSGPERAGAVLVVDLNAVQANYRQLRDRVAPAACAAVVKADAYGLGAERVAPALARAGCRQFFVAHLDEGLTVRRALVSAERSPTDTAAVYVLCGAPRGYEAELAEAGLVPVLNGIDDIAAWAALARRRGNPAPAVLHVDTGMSRLGLSPQEVAVLADDPNPLRGIPLAWIMSHLACADEVGHPLNERQRLEFTAACRRLPAAPTSLANSSGIFLGSPYHGDLARPGAALYGVAPQPGNPNPMSQVVNLKGKILQVRQIDTGRSVGYGATHRAERTTRIATVAVGYADGYLRSLSNAGAGFVGDRRVPLVGRVSMDLVTFDVTALPEQAAAPGQFIDLIGPHHGVDDVAAAARTIGYEILTGLGQRYRRVYVGGD